MPDLDLIKSYSFDLPAELIAQSPVPKREDARLLLIRRNPERGLPRYEDLLVSDLPKLVDEIPELKNYPWIRNTTRVIPARFYVLRKKRDGSGGFSRHEMVFLEEATNPQDAEVIIRNVSKFHFPEKVYLELNQEIEMTVTSSNKIHLSKGFEEGWKQLLQKYGEMPLPPYITHRDPLRDKERYQTVWAKAEELGSVAAPTASLHFSKELIKKLQNQSIRFFDLCLNVGLGTFEPVRAEHLSEHKIHQEAIYVPHDTLKTIQSAKVVCLGTTALRAVESLNENDFENSYVSRKTEIFIKPGFQFQYTKALWTNFHLPESTLFVLVTAFVGSLELAKEAYQHAIQKKYRFFSYGDATLWV